MADLAGFGAATISNKYQFYYAENVAHLLELVNKTKHNIEQKFAADQVETTDFNSCYVLGGLNTREYGHTYTVFVSYKDKKLYAAIFDSVKGITPAFTREIGNSFEQVMIVNDQFQHALIGCRGYAIDTFRAINDDEYYRQQLISIITAEHSEKEIQDYEKNFFTDIVQNSKAIEILENELVSKQRKLDTIKSKEDKNKTKVEIVSLEKEIKKQNNALLEIVTNKINAKDKNGNSLFDIKKFINNQSDIKKIKPQDLINYVVNTSKKLFAFEHYSPLMTHLIADYKTLHKHIKLHKGRYDEEIKNDQTYKIRQSTQDFINMMKKAITESNELQQQILAKNNATYITDELIKKEVKLMTENAIEDIEQAELSMKIIKEHIKVAIQYGYFVCDGKQVKNKKPEDIDKIIDEIATNPDSKYNFIGYKRREIYHICNNKIFNKITGYDKLEKGIKEMGIWQKRLKHETKDPFLAGESL